MVKIKRVVLQLKDFSPLFIPFPPVVNLSFEHKITTTTTTNACAPCEFVSVSLPFNKVVYVGIYLVVFFCRYLYIYVCIFGEFT